MAEMQEVSIESLRESKTNPRKAFEDIGPLTDSIKQHGLITPLLVRQNGASGDYEIVAGARRFRAAKAAKLKIIPVRIMELTDAQALEFQIVENLQREDVHPLDEALGYEHLMKSGHDAKTVAEKVNKSETYIHQRLQLTKLIPEAQKAFRSGKFLVTHAIILARIPSPERQKEFLKYAAEGKSAQQLAEAVYRENLLLKDAPWNLADATLVAKAGSCVNCPKRTGANPQLFPDIKEKDVCTDRDCFLEKMTAQVEQNTEKGLLSISLQYSYYGIKKIPGVLYGGEYALAEGKDCKSSRPAMVIAKSYEREKTPVGSEVKVCIDSKCSVHHGQKVTGGAQVSGMTPAQKAKMRHDKAVGAARTEAVRQIGETVEWPLSFEQSKAIAQGMFSRLVHESRKLACKVVGLWPKDGKVSMYDFNGEAEKYIRTADKNKLAGFMVVCSLVPTWGKWSMNSNEDEVKIKAAASGTDVSLAAIERQFLKESENKAKGKNKSKPSAKSKSKK